MIRFMTILIGCSLTLIASVRGEQQDQQDPKKKQKSKPVQQQQHIAPNQRTMPNTHVQGTHPQHASSINNAKIHNSNATKQQVYTPPNVHSNKVTNVQSNKLPAVQSNKLPAVQSNKLPAVQSNKLPGVQANKLPGVQANNRQVQRVQSQHVSFHARPSTTINSVQFNQNYRIHRSESWRGAGYQAFRSYHPVWHDRGWWHSHHNHIILIGGGWYFWNAGYWYPAWGYDTSAAYYPYDGPIYVGSSARPFDQVVADVQSVLQEQGYYNGEVDGLVGPLTQEALAAYQGAQGLEPTAAVDQPTLESLGLS